MANEAWVDLHIHTNFSDGLLTPAQAVEYASKVDLKAIGITDHDTIDGIPEAFEAGKRFGIEIVPGVELSSKYEDRDIHILGYYFDPENSRLQHYLECFRKERYRRAVKMVQNLNKLGVRMTIEEVEKRATTGNIGRPHLAEVLMEKGYVETFQEAFYRYIGYGSKAYEEKYKITPQEAIVLISEARGISLLAHPGYGISNEFIYNLVKSGLDGIEIVHPKLDDSRTQHLQKIAREYGILVAGGSDCHGGRNGTIDIGKYKIPYAMLEEMKSIFRMRWHTESERKDGGYDISKRFN